MLENQFIILEVVSYTWVEHSLHRNLFEHGFGRIEIAYLDSMKEYGKWDAQGRKNVSDWDGDFERILKKSKGSDGELVQHFPHLGLLHRWCLERRIPNKGMEEVAAKCSPWLFKDS